MRNLLFIVLIALMIVSCKKDDEKTLVNFAMQSIMSNLGGAKKANLAAVVKITDFKLSIRDVEFKQDESELDTNDVQFRGPFEVDLLDGSDALTQSLGTIEIQDGTYKILRFKLHKSRDWVATSDLYDRSLFVKGTIDDVPFEFWHDTSENFDIENIAGITIVMGSSNVTIKFDIDSFLNSLHTIDLSLAQDSDHDGLIKINPDNDDGNGDIADLLKENIKEAADLIKE